MSNLMFPLSPIAQNPLPPPSEPCGALAAQPCLAPVPAIPRVLPPSEISEPKRPAPAAPAPSPSARCSVRGCVFPAPFAGQTRCHYHQLLHSEAEHFQSHQPTYLLMLSAPFGIPDEEPDDSRQEDRKRQAAEREAFILDEPDELEW